MPDDRRIYFHNLRWAEPDPAYLINLDAERAELYRPLKGFVTAPPDARRGLYMAVIGAKGVGKSIVTLSVLKRLREEHSGQVVIVNVDCRRRRGWREVLAGVAEGLRDELYELNAARVHVPDYGFDSARLPGNDLAAISPCFNTTNNATAGTNNAQNNFLNNLSLQESFVNYAGIINLGNDTTLCNGDTIILNGGLNANLFLWQDGSTNMTYTVTTPGIYILNVVDGNYCAASDTIDIATPNSFIYDLVNDTTLCNGQSLVFDLTSLAANYMEQWKYKSNFYYFYCRFVYGYCYSKWILYTYRFY